MSKLAATFLCVLIATLSGLAQECPRITVEAPILTSEVGEKIPYTIRVEPADKLPMLSYLWSVTTSRGELGMVRGQGTNTIEVPWTHEAISVSVRVIGLATNCPDSASLSFEYDPPPAADKLDEFTGSLAKVPTERFNKIIEIAKRNPNAKLYILVSGARGNVARSIKAKRAILASRLLNGLGNHHDLRITFVEIDRNDDRVTIWLVPPGAEKPRPYTQRSQYPCIIAHHAMVERI